MPHSAPTHPAGAGAGAGAGQGGAGRVDDVQGLASEPVTVPAFRRSRASSSTPAWAGVHARAGDGAPPDVRELGWCSR